MRTMSESGHSPLCLWQCFVSATVRPEEVLQQFFASATVRVQLVSGRLDAQVLEVLSHINVDSREEHANRQFVGPVLLLEAKDV